MHAYSKYFLFNSLIISPPDRSNIKIVNTKEKQSWYLELLVDVHMSVCYAYFIPQVRFVENK